MKVSGKNSVQKSVLCGVLAALLAVLSQVSIPLPGGVPVTLQTFAVALCGYVLGPVMGTVSVAVYLALGAVGVPVFAGFSGGIGAFLGMAGGFLWGFLPMALLCGLGLRSGRKILALALGIVGLLACHLCGCVQYALAASLPFPQAFLTVSLPFLIKDVVSVALAYFAALAVAVSMKKADLGGAA